MNIREFVVLVVQFFTRRSHGKGGYQPDRTASKLSSVRPESFIRKCPTGTGLQILLESLSLGFVGESQITDQRPGRNFAVWED